MLSNHESIDDHRYLALEALNTLCDRDAKLVRQGVSPATLKAFVAQLFEMLSRVRITDDEWLALDPHAEDEEEPEVGAAEMALRRLCISIGTMGSGGIARRRRRLAGSGQPIRLWALISTLTDEAAKHPDWRRRLAALKALEACAQGLAADVKPELRTVVPFVLSRIRATNEVGDSLSSFEQHFRVRHAACSTIREWTQELPQALQVCEG